MSALYLSIPEYGLHHSLAGRDLQGNEFGEAVNSVLSVQWDRHSDKLLYVRLWILRSVDSQSDLLQPVQRRAGNCSFQQDCYLLPQYVSRTALIYTLVD